MGKFKKQEDRSKPQETFKAKSNKITKKSNKKIVEVKNKINLKHDDIDNNLNLIKKINKNMIGNKGKKQKLNLTNGIIKSSINIDTDDNSKGINAKKQKKTSPLKMNVGSTKNPTPQMKKLNGKVKTVLAPTPELKKPKTVLAPTPTPKKKKIQKNKAGMFPLAEQGKNEQNKLDQNNKKLVKKIKKINKNKSVTSIGVMPFDEKKFNDIVNLENVEKSITALNKIVKEESNKMKNSIFSDYRYVLNVTCFKIPSCPKRTVKLRVKHKLVSDEDDVAFIVRDLRRGAKRDYEPTVHHWEDLLRKHDINEIKAIIPFNQLKKEYSTYEMKIKFSNMYEHYLCDAAISGHVVGFLGKSCSKKTRSTIFSVRTQNLNNLKNEIHKSLGKTCYHQGQKGNMISIPIGTDKMSSTQVAENLLQVVDELKTVYVGGLPNIRNMNLRINLKSTSSVPIYISLAEAPSGTPFSIGPREKRLSKLKDQANEILSRFELSKTGELLKLPRDKVLLKRAAAEIESKDGQIGIKKQKRNELFEKSTAENFKDSKILEKIDKKNKADSNISLTQSQKSNSSEEEMDNVQYKDDDEIKESDSEINDDVFSDYEEEDESDDIDESDETGDEGSEESENENDANEGDETDEKNTDGIDSDDDTENDDEDEESD